MDPALRTLLLDIQQFFDVTSSVWGKRLGERVAEALREDERMMVGFDPSDSNSQQTVTRHWRCVNGEWVPEEPLKVDPEAG